MQGTKKGWDGFSYFPEKFRFFYCHRSIEQFMFHQGAYNVIAQIGKESEPAWKIEDLEKHCFADHYFGPNLNESPLKEKLETALAVVNAATPFLRFKDKGEHYAYELFLTSPGNWGSRGAPFLWAYLARQFTYDRLPMSKEDFIKKYLSMISQFGLGIKGDNYVYIKEFAAGGMSSGVVGNQFCKMALDKLLFRLKKYG